MSILHTDEYDDWSGYPLLWRAYFQSLDASCCTYLISLPDADCSQRFDDETFLIRASMCPFHSSRHRQQPPIAAYKSIVQHPTTDVNAESDSADSDLCKDTALHKLLEDFENSFCEIIRLLPQPGIRISTYDDASKHLQSIIDCNAAVRKIKVLLEAGADPQAQNDWRRKGTAMEYFHSISAFRFSDQRNRDLFDGYCEEIEEAMQSALQP